jgi:hypothetical protein
MHAIVVIVVPEMVTGRHRSNPFSHSLSRTHGGRQIGASPGFGTEQML